MKLNGNRLAAVSKIEGREVCLVNVVGVNIEAADVCLGPAARRRVSTVFLNGFEESQPQQANQESCLT